MSSYTNQMISEIASLLSLQTGLPLQASNLNIREVDEFFSRQLDGLLIRGDNLSALQELSKSREGSINLCYIDPPYNTCNKFVYNDTRLSDEKGAFGVHAAWMAFMLPRLALAHQLLSEDGFLCVSIDDYEQPYLRLLLDSIFGSSNFVGNIVVVRSKNGKGSSRNIAVNHEYLVVYGKSSKSQVIGLGDDVSKYDKVDEYGRFKIDGLFRKKGDASRREDRPNMFYPLFYNKDGHVFTQYAEGLSTVYPIDSSGTERRWLWGLEKASKDSWKLYASKNGVIYVKNYSSHDKKVKLRSVWDDNSYLTERATKEVKDIYGDKVFETPKPLKLIEDVILSLCTQDSIILDFFAGSGTTAQAAHNLNIVDGGSRKVLLVEQSVGIPKNHIAYSKGFKCISEITVARLAHIKSLHHDYTYAIV
ncbi:site-specific DNA-methyltransferase [Pseudomonas sp. PH1b]|uniref:site-specific DNA-methyltransferase n=1 Tax=Pseudomonas sp. PH1b TaxID=1397282 RepID=UPI000469B6C3|nr:site-specific DNA-methyltransferase [Pseudomonas sp. PH1b]